MHAAKVGFVRIYSFVVEMPEGGTPDSLWRDTSRHTIVLPGYSTVEDQIGLISGQSWYGPFTRSNTKYTTVPGSVRQITPKR